jgi:hypothetical protein
MKQPEMGGVRDLTPPIFMIGACLGATPTLSNMNEKTDVSGGRVR